LVNRIANATLQALSRGFTLGTIEVGHGVLALVVYTFSSFYQTTTGTLTLDAQGDTNAFWAIHMGSHLTAGTPMASDSVSLVKSAG
jgi:hypothetical protein